MKEEKAVILGGGPAGLAAAYQLVKNSYPICLLEKDEQVGGLSKTCKYKDCYFDIGGHRFFTRVPEVMQLWFELLEENFKLTSRQSRIYYKEKLFNYPIKPLNALTNLGLVEFLLVLASFARGKFVPYKQVNTFEEWVSQQFGRRLFGIFFKSYTEKLWGLSCNEISSEWAAQRIKGLSLKTLLKSSLVGRKSNKIRTLIQEFHYPELGPGMMYTKLADVIRGAGGEVRTRSRISRINHDNNQITSVRVERGDGVEDCTGSYFLSSIPITEFLRKLTPAPPPEVMEAVAFLSFRSHLTVNLLVDQKDIFPDNWLYIHSPDIKIGRIQNYKNWSPKMVYNQDITTLGVEYFCDEGDELWNTGDADLLRQAKKELGKTKLLDVSRVFDGFVIRAANAYPVYRIGYKEKLGGIVSFINRFKNLYCIGRAGQYQYNNMDHSMLSGFLAAKNIVEPEKKYDIWHTKIEGKHLEY